MLDEVEGEWQDIDVCVEIDECERYDNPCENGGTCVDKINAYECECLHEFHGVHCNSTHDDCAHMSDEEACGQGTCVDLPRAEYGQEHFECTCNEGWGKFEGQVSCLREYSCKPFHFNVPGLIGDVDADITCYDGIELKSTTTTSCGLACDSGFRAAYLPYAPNNATAELTCHQGLVPAETDFTCEEMQCGDDDVGCGDNSICHNAHEEANFTSYNSSSTNASMSWNDGVLGMNFHFFFSLSLVCTPH